MYVYIYIYTYIYSFFIIFIFIYIPFFCSLYSCYMWGIYKYVTSFQKRKSLRSRCAFKYFFFSSTSYSSIHFASSCHTYNCLAHTRTRISYIRRSLYFFFFIFTSFITAFKHLIQILQARLKIKN